MPVVSSKPLGGTPYRTSGLVLRKDENVWVILADGATLNILNAVLALPEDKGGCNTPYLYPEVMARSEARIYNANTTATDGSVIGHGTIVPTSKGMVKYLIYPWNVIQFYRGSSVALGSEVYNNTFAQDGNTNPDYWASSPLNTTGIDMNFLQCLNQTIAAAIPIVNPKLVVRSRLSNGIVAAIVLASVPVAILILGGLWLWYLKRRKAAASVRPPPLYSPLE